MDEEVKNSSMSESDMELAWSRFFAARLSACVMRPYFARGLMAMQPTMLTTSEFRMGVAADKRARLYMSAEWMIKTPVSDLAVVLIHELYHIIRLHASRSLAIVAQDPDLTDRPETLEERLSLDSHLKLWNIAADCEINDDMVSDGLRVDKVDGGDVILPSTFKLPEDLLAEEYYKLLKKDNPGKLPSDSPNFVTGSASDGISRSWEYGDSDSDASVDKSESKDVPKGLSEAEIDMISRTIAKRVLDYARSAGDVPQSLVRWASGVVEPRVPWQSLLRCKLANGMQRKSGSRMRTYMRPSRREGTDPSMLVASSFDVKLRIRVQADTSGSMCDGYDIPTVLEEVASILRSHRDSTEFGAVDAALHKTALVRDMNLVKDLMIGGGGTDMNLPIEYVRQEKYSTRPDVLIIITDGYVFKPWPTDPVPGVSVVVVTTNDEPKEHEPPSWIQTIRLRHEKAASV